jgi:hypothetical protein
MPDSCLALRLTDGRHMQSPWHCRLLSTKHMGTSRAAEPARSNQRTPRSQARSHPPTPTNPLLNTSPSTAGSGSLQEMTGQGSATTSTASLAPPPDNAFVVEALQAPAAPMPAQLGTSQISSSNTEELSACLEAVCLPGVLGEGRRCWAWIASQPTISATHVETSASGIR